MKLIIMFIVAASVFATSCKKEKDETVTFKTFAQITAADIAAKQTGMSSGQILASNSSAVLWKAGDIILYKTNENRFGKLEVISIITGDNYKLTIRATTYKADGSVYKFSDNLSIAGTWSADLDAVEQTSSNLERDFHWNRQTATDTYLTPYNNALYSKYNF